MRPLALAFVASTACNAAFDLSATAILPDAGPPPDTDGDLVIDLEDNCPGTPNDQSDHDQDLVGDVCDNCPLVSNPRQELEGDDDSVGTACDPHPDVGGDCLVLFESFSDPSRFEQTWTVYATAPPTIATSAGSVTVTPADANRFSIVARDNAGVLLDGLFDTQLAASLELAMAGAVLAASSIPPDTTYGYGCGVRWPSALEIGAAAYDSSAVDGTLIAEPPLFGVPVTNQLIARLNTPTAEAKALRCRAEYGGAVGTSVIAPVTQRPAGAPGVIVQSTAVTLEAVAFYRVQSGPCTTTFR